MRYLRTCLLSAESILLYCVQGIIRIFGDEMHVPPQLVKSKPFAATVRSPVIFNFSFRKLIFLPKKLL
jgi:hypothetical protein